ncbi:MAG: hypothetical protein OXE53_07245 [Deltaproteobacteria bacterium]|nr:hypothetical protein [Deltaproteobacteria bacterium]
MTRFSVLLSAVALVAAIAAMSAGGSGIRDVVDPDLTDEVEVMLAQSPLREFAGVAPLAAEPSTAAPYSVAPLAGRAFVEGGYLPLTDLDALYGVDGYGVPAVVAPAPAHVEPPADLVDDTPALIVSAWANPPPDAK